MNSYNYMNDSDAQSLVNSFYGAASGQGASTIHYWTGSPSVSGYISNNELFGNHNFGTLHQLKVQNNSDIPWDAYKNWADYGSTAIEGMYKWVVAQRTDLYNRGYCLGNQRSIRYAGRAVDSQIGLRSAYVAGTARFVKYAERAGSVGKVLGAIEIGKGIYDDKWHFGRNAQVATAGVVGGLVGAAEGALIGAYIGSFIPVPGAGTVLGVVVGAGVGYLYGKIAEGAVEKIYE